MATISRFIQELFSNGEATEIKIGGAGADNSVPNLAQTGLMAFRNSQDLALPLTAVYSKVDIFDTVDIDSARGHMTYDAINAKLTFNTTGVYKFRADGSFQLANNVDVEFSFYLNGVIVNPNNNPVFTGLGNKNVAMGAVRDMQLNAGDYLEIWAKVSADNTLTLKSSNISVEKTTY